MKGYEFIDNKGTFKLEDPDLYSYLYFPVGAASGMMGSLTPEFGGDLKTSQNTFILEPVSSDNLHNNRSTRMAMCVLSMGPILLVYPFFQKYFVKGLTVGAVKG